MSTSLCRLGTAAWISLATLLASPPQQPPAPSGLALLIALENYAQPDVGGVAALGGPRNDVRRARSVLIDRFHFAQSDIKVLVDKEATHEAIVRAVHDHLIANAGKDTLVVLWFSGHGSKIVDATGLEDSKSGNPADGSFDNSLLAYDSRAGKRHGCYDISDDELYSLMTVLAQKTPHALLVTDSCHSAGLSRGAAHLGVRNQLAGTETLDRQSIEPFWPQADVPFLDDDAERGAGQAFVHIAACADQEEAGEVLMSDRAYGTLSWYLCEALEQTSPTTSWRRLCEEVRARVAICASNSRPRQTVCWQGDVDRQVFGGGFVAPPPGFGVDRNETDGMLRIAAGRIHGVAPGAAFRIVDLDNREVGRASACYTDIVWCWACWQGKGTDVPDGTALRALPVALPAGMVPLRILPGAGVDPALLTDCAWAVPAEADSCDYRLESGGPGGGLLLLDRDGERIRPAPNTKAGAQTVFYQEWCFRSLWEAAGNPGAHAVRVRVSVEAPDAAMQAEVTRMLQGTKPAVASFQKPADDVPMVMVKASTLTETAAVADAGGGLLAIRVTNESDRPLYFNVLSVCEDRSIHLMWDSPDHILQPGRSKTLPVLVGPSGDWQRERPMVDRYVVLATEEPCDMSSYAAKAPNWSARRGASEAPTAAPQFLQMALRKRGKDPRDIGWGVTWVDIVLPTR